MPAMQNAPGAIELCCGGIHDVCLAATNKVDRIELQLRKLPEAVADVRNCVADVRK